MSIFRHVRTLHAPPSAVFEAFQNPERLARWWGPSGFSNSFHTFEFRPGGRWVFTMHGPDAKDYPDESIFVEIVPSARVCIQHISLPRYALSITLESVALGTLLTWVGEF